MTGTLISLISIIMGILGAYCISYLYKSYSLGLIGNTIAGVFGSILLIKSIGRLGFDPKSVIENEIFHIGLFIINLLISLIGGAFAVITINKLKEMINKYSK